MRLNKIAGYRAMLGMTQEEFGRMISMSKQQYSQKERGERAFNDKEKEKVKEILLPYFPEITIDNIFFDVKVFKSKG